MPAECTFRDLLLTARTRMADELDQQEIYKLCRAMNGPGLLQLSTASSSFARVAGNVNPFLAEKLGEANTVSEAVDAFYLTAETDYVSDADRMTADHAVLYLFERMFYGLVTGIEEIDNVFGRFYAKMMAQRLGEQIDKLPADHADEVPLMALEAERLEALQRRLCPRSGLFAYFPATWAQVEGIRNVKNLKRLFEAGLHDRLYRALAGLNQIDRQILRTDDEFFKLFDRIKTRMEMRGLKLDDLADDFRKAYGLPPNTPVNFEPGLGSVHLHQNRQVLTSFGKRRSCEGPTILLKL